MDVAGEQQNGVAQDMVKTRLSPTGEVLSPGVNTKVIEKMSAPDYCGSCYGAETEETKVGVEGSMSQCDVPCRVVSWPVVTRTCVRGVQCCNTCDDLVRVYNLKGWSVAALGSTEQCADSGMGEPGEGCHIAGHLQVNKVRGTVLACVATAVRTSA